MSHWCGLGVVQVDEYMCTYLMQYLQEKEIYVLSTGIYRSIHECEISCFFQMEFSCFMMDPKCIISNHANVNNGMCSCACTCTRFCSH